MQKKSDYQVIVIGGGSAGYAAARLLSDEGIKTAIIDGADELGGLCILRGCMPSKAIIESAKRFNQILEAEKFGITLENPQINTKAVIERKNQLIDEFKGYRQEQLVNGKFDLIRGTANFTDPHTISVSQKNGASQILTASHFIIANGSKVFIPEIAGLAETGFLTSDDVLTAQSLPKSITILGGGAIALELAYYYAACQTEVTIIQRSDQLLSTMDQDIAKEIQVALEALGVNIFCDTDIQRVTTDTEGKKTVHFNHQNHPTQVSSDEILCGLGRSPNTKNLGCDLADLELAKGKIKVDLTMQSSQAHIYAAGDVCSPLDVVHLAIIQAEAAAGNILKQLNNDTSDPIKVDYQLSLYGIFTEPQIAAVGMSEKEARAANINYKTADYPFNDHGKSMVHGSEHGFVKLIVAEETGKIIGGAVIGPEAVELIHEIVVAMSFGATARQLLEIPHYHPTLSEIWTYPAEELAT
ncbi:MAG: pyruvate/2-oxoglutarate dehydrogenase complex dihydrolipoamide dehydrogenase (E3) component [Rubritalea sp.]|jgi:pyruvate/2-oxoglutarate dehydrogenase complex dihydrolipoamide dehydrogenase (E3) component